MGKNGRMGLRAFQGPSDARYAILHFGRLAGACTSQLHSGVAVRLFGLVDLTPLDTLWSPVDALSRGSALFVLLFSVAFRQLKATWSLGLTEECI